MESEQTPHVTRTARRSKIGNSTVTALCHLGSDFLSGLGDAFHLSRAIHSYPLFDRPIHVSGIRDFSSGTMGILRRALTKRKQVYP